MSTLAQRLWETADTKVFKPETFREARQLMREASEDVAEMRRIIHYAVNWSGARELFSEGFIEDANAILKKVGGNGDGK